MYNPERTLSVVEPGHAGTCEEGTGVRVTVQETARGRNCVAAANAGFFNTSTGQCLGERHNSGFRLSYFCTVCRMSLFTFLLVVLCCFFYCSPPPPPHLALSLHPPTLLSACLCLILSKPITTFWKTYISIPRIDLFQV